MPAASFVAEDVHSATTTAGRPDNPVIDVLHDEAGFA
jgi:hypothetical protein